MKKTIFLLSTAVFFALGMNAQSRKTICMDKDWGSPWERTPAPLTLHSMTLAGGGSRYYDWATEHKFLYPLY